MSTFDEHDGEDLEPGAIGVGMGGSCPVCRAPVDLGQEFCLECGSPIRFTPRQRRQQRGSARGAGVGAAAAAATAHPPGRFAGFPWVPFLIVLALIGGGVAFALVDSGGSDAASKKASSESALPSITNDVPTTETNSNNVTQPGCNALGGTQPAVTDPTTGQPAATTDPTTGEQIPQVADGSGTATDTTADAFADQTAGVPATTSSTDSGNGVATVDEQGDLCPTSGSGAPATSSPTDPLGTTSTPTTDATTTATDTTTTTSTSATGSWPANKDGWTVVVAGNYETQARANERAADLQDDGYTDGGVLFSSDFKSLCPGFYVVFSGVFDSESKANARLKKLNDTGRYAGMYVREVKKSGTSPSSCGSTRTLN